jgi:hypothetical protein
MAAGNSNIAKIGSQTQGCNVSQNERWRSATPRANSAGAPDAAEARNLRRLHFMIQLLIGTILQDTSLTVDEASQMVANTRNAALRMFPGKEQTFQMLCRPRIQRAMRERFHIQ